MARKSDFSVINSDDDLVSRIFSLALRFFGTKLPLSSVDIWNEFYPNNDEESFKRSFLRDRELLATLGIVIREVERDGVTSRWQINREASYMQGEGISADDARMLYVLCHDFVGDPSFAYRDELRMALAKISQMYQGASTLQASVDDQADRDHLFTLVGAMSSHHAVEVTYVDARGNSSKRLLALLGSFGMRERTYFVASRVTRDGELVDDSIRTYRLDRFAKVSLPRRTISYEVPLDFSVHDYERLPFQIGDAFGMAQLLVSPNPSREVVRALTSNGSVDDERHWTVSFNNHEALAAWCIANDVQPLSPDELVSTYRETLTRTISCDLVWHGTVPATATPQRPASRGRAGRKGGVLLARQLMTLATSLTREGEVITAERVSDALGISYDRARHLILLMTLSGVDSYEYLPVITDDDYHEVFLMEGAHLSAPRLRLTQSETMALLAALTELGVDDDDPLATALRQSFAAPQLTRQDVARSLELPSLDDSAQTLRHCSQAIMLGRVLTFRYRPVAGGKERLRRVIPSQTRRNDDSWYLDAFDLDRNDRRVFRVDRMSALTLSDEPCAPVAKVAEHQTKTVNLHFADRTYLDLFFWEGLQVLATDETGLLASIPYYGGDWLARHVAACAGSVRTTSDEVARRAAELAHGYLSATGM